jgi:hypothetical protein
MQEGSEAHANTSQSTSAEAVPAHAHTGEVEQATGGVHLAAVGAPVLRALPPPQHVQRGREKRMHVRTRVWTRDWVDAPPVNVSIETV